MATAVYRRPGAMKRRVRRTIGWLGFYLLLALIILYTVFPFYWAIVSSLRSGQGLFSTDLFPSDPAWGNYRRRVPRAALRPQHPELAVRRGLDRGALARPRRRRLLRARPDPVPRPHAAPAHHPGRLDVPADRGAVGHVRAGHLARHLQQPARAHALLHDLHPAVHGLGAHHLHARPAQGARGGGDRRRGQALHHRHQGVPAADGAGPGHHRACLPSSPPGTSSCSR